MRLTQECRPRKLQEIVFQSMPPDTILLNLKNGYYYSTNQIGAAVWERCDGTKRIADIVVDIQAIFDAPSDVEDDVVRFIQDMVEERLLGVTNE